MFPTPSCNFLGLSRHSRTAPLGNNIYSEDKYRQGKGRNSELASSLEVFDTFFSLQSPLPYTLEMELWLQTVYANTNSLKEEEQGHDQNSYLASAGWRRV